MLDVKPFTCFAARLSFKIWLCSYLYLLSDSHTFFFIENVYHVNTSLLVCSEVDSQVYLESLKLFFSELSEDVCSLLHGKFYHKSARHVNQNKIPSMTQ